MFTHHGITLADKPVIGLKNLYKHRDVFAPLVRDQLFVATPGACPPDWAVDPVQAHPAADVAARSRSAGAGS